MQVVTLTKFQGHSSVEKYFHLNMIIWVFALLVSPSSPLTFTGKAAGVNLDDHQTRCPYSKLPPLEVTGWPEGVAAMKNPKYYGPGDLRKIIQNKDIISIR